MSQDEIARQSQMMQNQLGAQAIGAGAFGGGREGVQQAELQGRIYQLLVKHKHKVLAQHYSSTKQQQQVGLAAGQQL